MPFTKEQYQEYYQKIKEERNKKRREEYLTHKSKVDEKEEAVKVDENSLVQVDEIVRPEPKIFVEPPVAKLWSDYYLVKKPTCPTCQQKGISTTAYQFCLEELIAPREYQCLVKHFTIYQGKNFLRQHQELVTNNFVKLEVVANQVEQIVQPSLAEKNAVETAPLAPEEIIREDERFITYAKRLWDKKHQKYVYYSCADSCWNRKYCSNCSD